MPARCEVDTGLQSTRNQYQRTWVGDSADLSPTLAWTPRMTSGAYPSPRAVWSTTCKTLSVAMGISSKTVLRPIPVSACLVTAASTVYTNIHVRLHESHPAQYVVHGTTDSKDNTLSMESCVSAFTQSDEHRKPCLISLLRANLGLLLRHLYAKRVSFCIPCISVGSWCAFDVHLDERYEFSKALGAAWTARCDACRTQ